MQPGVTVVLATVWLAVYAGVVGTATLHPSRLALDQYSPLAPQRHGVRRRVGGRPDWRDQNPGENQPFDLSIYPRRSTATSTESLEQSIDDKYLERDLLFSRTGNSALDDFSSLVEDKQSRNSVGGEFTDGKVDGRSTKGTELPSREQPPSELDDPFVADDTFQDQGPGSVEIYKLDLLREKPLLDPTPVARLLTKNKSKTPKKTSHASWKSKTTEYKATSPKVLRKQSNSFDDLSTGMPPNNDPFSVGGVPELQVGCEGLEASDHKQKRSIDDDRRGKKAEDAADFWVDITPISLEMDYDSSAEDAYEEMDELVRIKKLENTTKNPKRRGDIDATGESSDDKKRAEKLPVRGDLGSSSVGSDPAAPSTMPVPGDRRGKVTGTGNGGLRSDKARRGARDVAVADKPTANRGRKILWLDEADANERPADRKRSRRSIWGFGEDEGVLSSDELQTENQRRRQYDERRRQEEERRRREQERRRQEEAQRRGHIENRTNSDIGRIREEYERRLEQAQREEEDRRRRLQQESQRTPANRWQPEEEYRRRVQGEEEARRSRWQDEERRRQEVEASRGRYEPRPRASPADDEGRMREEEPKRRGEDRAWEEERRRLQGEEARRREQHEREEEIKRRRQQELDRRNLEDRRREWMLKRRQEEEEERRRQEGRNEPPANLLYPMRASPNETRIYRVDDERRMMEQREKEREQKLREYVQRNRPINVNSSVDRQREEANWRRAEEERRRLEEERKLQEYIRRNQPVHVPKANGSYDRNWLEGGRPVDDVRLNNRSRYPGPGNGRRDHGPSASTNIDPRNYVDEARRRDEARRIEEEERARETQRIEALRREEEVRRAQSRRYEEQRRRQEAARLEAERRTKELIEEEARRSQAGRTRPGYEDRRRFEEHRRRQDTRLIPANLFLNESRRAGDLERQRQEQERRRVEAERRRQQESRAKEAREERARAMKEQWRRQEEARLNALPVSARIIVRHGPSSPSPGFLSRAGFDNDIDFSGINPNRDGVQSPRFPVPPTRRPPVKAPAPCVWAVVQCCPVNKSRLVTCFEATGCPGINWDPNPCRVSILQAAKEQVRKFYAEAEADENV